MDTGPARRVQQELVAVRIGPAVASVVAFQRPEPGAAQLQPVGMRRGGGRLDAVGREMGKGQPQGQRVMHRAAIVHVQQAAPHPAIRVHHEVGETDAVAALERGRRRYLHTAVRVQLFDHDQPRLPLDGCRQPPGAFADRLIPVDVDPDRRGAQAGQALDGLGQQVIAQRPVPDLLDIRLADDDQCDPGRGVAGRRLQAQVQVVGMEFQRFQVGLAAQQGQQPEHQQ